MTIAIYIGLGIFASVGLIWLVAPQIFLHVDPTRLRKGSAELRQYERVLRNGRIFGVFTLVLVVVLVFVVALSGVAA